MVSWKHSFHLGVSHLKIHQSASCVFVGYKKTTCVKVYLKPECPIPKTSLEWNEHFTQDAKTWVYHFLEMMDEFTKLSNIEREANKERLKNEPPIDLGSDICFDAF